MIRTLIGGLFGAIASAIAVAEQTAPAVPPAEEPPSIHRYGDVDAACRQWIDGCRACDRGNEGGAPVCSNIGIACQPKAVQCTARKEEPAK